MMKKIFDSIRMLLRHTGWDKIKRRKDVHTVEFSTIDLPNYLVTLIESCTGYDVKKYRWYSFFDNYKLSKDFSEYDKEKYDIFPYDLYMNNPKVKVLYNNKKDHSGTVCTWNDDIKVGFLSYHDHYGYFVLKH